MPLICQISMHDNTDEYKFAKVVASINVKWANVTRYVFSFYSVANCTFCTEELILFFKDEYNYVKSTVHYINKYELIFRVVHLRIGQLATYHTLNINYENCTLGKEFSDMIGKEFSDMN